MEQRRYLAAVLGMAATFALVSHTLQSGPVDRWLQQKPDLVSELKCATSAVGAKVLGMISPTLRPGDLDAAWLLAKLNLGGADAKNQAKPQPPVPPVAPVAPQVQTVAVQVDCPELLKAQEKAIRSAERMQHNMERMQAKLEKAQSKLERAQSQFTIMPGAENVDWKIPSAADLNRQIEMSLRAEQGRLVAQAARAQKAAQALANAQAAMASLEMQNTDGDEADAPAIAAKAMRGVAPTVRINVGEVQHQSSRSMQRKTIHSVPKNSHPVHSTGANL